MKCNIDKCKEVSVIKRGCSRALRLVRGIEQLKERTVLGLTLQDDCKYSAHVRSKIWEANKYLFIKRSLRKEGYTQTEVDKLFHSLIITKFMYALPVYATNQFDLNAIQHFLTRCYKRPCTIDGVNIFNLLEQCDRRLFLKIKGDSCHPLYHLAPKAKVTSYQLRAPSSARPERFEDSFFNTLNLLSS